MVNRQYNEMYAAAVSRLSGLDIRAGAQADGLICGDNEMFLPILGQKAALNLTDYSLSPQVEMWEHLIILQYLETMDGTKPNERWLGMSELSSGGVSRGQSFDREVDNLIAQRLGQYAPETVQAACAALGGAMQYDARADLCVVLYYLPRFPMRLQLWYADDEFPASGKLLVNDGVKHRLGVEAVGTLAALLVHKLCATCEQAAHGDQ